MMEVGINFGAGVIDNSKSPNSRIHAFPLRRIEVMDGFWKTRMAAARDKGLGRLLELLEENGVVDNFRRISHRKKVERRGPLFTDSDLYKWMEAAAFVLQTYEDPQLMSKLNGIIEDVVEAQEDDGYLNTYFVDERAKDRFSNLGRDHELYCAGHLIQAAIAHYRATGQTKLLNCASRFADYLIFVFGPGKRRGFCGHPELEMAMVELFRTTGVREYLDFAGYLLDQIGFSSRGEMEGHAVRAGYACCGGADYFAETGDEDTWMALDRLWRDMAQRKIYITGGIGSRYVDESFGEPYELPNLRAYAETCAAISNAMWNWRMLLITGDCRYSDMLERILYNGFLSGISLSGNKYFYMNPLESSGAIGKEEWGHQRKEWYTCTCCPTNVQRRMASFPGYIYASGKDEIWINLYQASRLKHKLKSGSVTIEQKTNYPWEGRVELIIDVKSPACFAIIARVPYWTPRCSASINGQEIRSPRTGSYIRLEREWSSGDKVLLVFEMPVRLMDAHHRVREDFGCVAITRGPLVYCVESIDNPAFPVQDLMLSPNTNFTYRFEPNLLGGVGVLCFEAIVADSEDNLYTPLKNRNLSIKQVKVVAIPYFAWANRGASSMIVWIPLSDSNG